MVASTSSAVACSRCARGGWAVFGLAAARRLRGVAGDRYSAGNGSWTTLLMVVITMCLCSAAAAVAAEHPIIPVDPHAKLPPMGSPNEFQVTGDPAFVALPHNLHHQHIASSSS